MSDYSISLYSECPDTIQQIAISTLEQIFSDDLEGRPIKPSDYEKFWIIHDNTTFIGSISLDNNVPGISPCIGNLYIDESKRRNGYGSKLIDLAEEYALKTLNAHTIYLWCREDVKSYYEKRGYSMMRIYPPGFIMWKFIRDY